MGIAGIDFELTTRCNLDCVHCLRDRSLKADLPVELIAKILKEVKPYGIDRVGITGGEPLLHPQFKEVIELFVKEGFLFSLVSNGIELPKFIDFFKSPKIKEKLQSIVVSLEGPEEETNDAVRGKGSFKKALKGVVALKANNIPFGIKFSINALNYKKIEEMALFAGKLGAREVNFGQIYPSPESLSRGLMLEPEQWVRIKPEIARLAELVKIPVVECVPGWYEHVLPLCTSMKMEDYYVDARGWLGFCCVLPGVVGSPAKERDRIADLRTTSFVEAHRKLIDLIREMRLIWLERIEKGEVSDFDHYMCLNCGFHLGKLKWLEDFKDSSWWKLLESAKPQNRR